MGWFDEQIRQRIQNDNDSFAEAFADMASVIMGKGAIISRAERREQAGKGRDKRYFKIFQGRPTGASRQSYRRKRTA